MLNAVINGYTAISASLFSLSLILLGTSDKHISRSAKWKARTLAAVTCRLAGGHSCYILLNGKV